MRVARGAHIHALAHEPRGNNMQAFKRHMLAKKDKTRFQCEVTNDRGKFSYVAASARSQAFYRFKYFATMQQIREMPQLLKLEWFTPARLAEYRRWAKQDGFYLP
jgi:hypothetical protein